MALHVGDAVRVRRTDERGMITDYRSYLQWPYTVTFDSGVRYYAEAELEPQLELDSLTEHERLVLLNTLHELRRTP